MAFFASCSRKELFLKYADTFISYRINSDFDHSKEQKKVSNEIIDQMVSEFKKSSVPEINDLVKNIVLEFNQIEAINQIEKEKAYYLWLIDVHQRIKILFSKQMDLVAKYVPRFAINLKSQNWQSYQKEFREKNKEIIKDKKNKSFANTNIRDIFEDLTIDQENLLTLYVEKYPSKPQLRVENREYQLKKFMDLMGNEFNTEKFESALIDRLKNPKNWNLPSFQNESDQRVEDLLRVLARMFSLSDSEQKKVITKKFSNLLTF